MRLALVLAALALASAARAAVVHLKDGGRVEGTVVSATARDVLVHTASGERRIDAADIASIDYSSGAPQPAPPAEEGQVWRNIEESRREQLGVGLGITAPVSDVDFASAGGGRANNGDVGAQLGLRYLHRVAPRWDLGVDADYFHRSATRSFGLLPSAEANVGGDTLLFLGTLRWMPRRERSVRPYVLAGLGGHRTTTVIDATPAPGFAWSDTQTAETRRLVDAAAWGLAGTARLGVEFDVSDPGVFAFELGWLGLESSRYAATPDGRALGVDSVNGPIHALVFSGRYGWRF